MLVLLIVRDPASLRALAHTDRIESRHVTSVIGLSASSSTVSMAAGRSESREELSAIGQAANLAEGSLVTTSPAATGAGLSGHIIGPTLARDAQMIEQFLSPREGIAESHVRPNPYSVYSDNPSNPVVYMKVPKQRTAASSGNGTPGFKQCEIMNRILEPLGPSLVELYFNVIHSPFPILDEMAVMKAYHQGALPHTLVCEIYAVSLVFWELSDKIISSYRPLPDVRYLWNLTVSALHVDFLSPSLSTVLACILDLLGRPITSITYNAVNVGSAVALAQSLGLNRDSSDWNLDRRQKSLRVRTWWGLLIHDYWASLCHGTPSHIHRDQWDVAMPEISTILDDAPFGDPSVAKARQMGAQSFVALCKLTKILGEVLPIIYSLRREALEHTLKTLRRIETYIDDWQDSLPSWLNPDDVLFGRNQPGALNLRLSFLAVKMCIRRVALQATRVLNDEESRYRQVQCIKAGSTLIDFVVSLSVDETKAFWLPYTAYHFVSAATLMMRCALEAETDAGANDCVKSARKLIDYLRKMKTDTNWDLADICLGQCESMVKHMSEGDYLEYRRRKVASDRYQHVQPQFQVTGRADMGHVDENGHVADAQSTLHNSTVVMTDGFLGDDTRMLEDWQQYMPENFYFPELWQVSHNDLERWT
ncbi:fungal specific transcription factor domain-containing protein [Seiridium cupressi]